MKKIFLSHATEDKPLVEHIYNKLKTKYPELEPWLDKYEIVGGDSLIDKISEGIEASEKFLIFLSDVSITKPWVNKELKKAIIQEVNNGNKNFIIPILVNNIIKIPFFLEDKFYIEVGKYTEEQLIDAIYFSINEKHPNSSGQTMTNLIINPGKTNHGFAIEFKSKAWAEDISFEIKIPRPFIRAIKGFQKSPNTFDATFYEELIGNTYRICVASQRITPDNSFFVHFIFNEEIESNILVSVKKWPEGFKRPMRKISEVRG